MKAKEQIALLESALGNSTVFKCFEKSMVVLENNDKIAVSISGGADSDIVLDICTKIRRDLRFIWFDTGAEYQATKEHLEFLEKRYGIRIERVKAKEPVPKAVRHYGYPFLGKNESEFIGRLQAHGFKWEDKPFEALWAEYPKCKAALRWWCNEWGKGSRFNIDRWKYLKEFMIANPPTFPISAGCCKGAKKDTAHDFDKRNGIKIAVTGERKAEGGARAGGSSCFTGDADKQAIFRPIFWFKNEDKRFYEDKYGIVHSRCYTEYGLKRTGCVGCPFGQNWQYELEVAKKYEPKLYKLCIAVFGKSYEYALRYYEFRKQREMDLKRKE